MKVHSLSFRVELEAGDPSPSGTSPQQAAQLWQAVTARELPTFRVRKLDYDHSTGDVELFVVEAVGEEIFQ